MHIRCSICREDEDDEQQVHPVVKESAGKLVETGINTLQKTLLLKKEVEVDQVNAQLQQKRDEFQQRMEICSQKQAELEIKQQQVQNVYQI